MAAAAAALTGGCVFQSVDELYALPILPNEYSDLQATIQATVDDLKAEYATINSGDNTSVVQLLDLDAVRMADEDEVSGRGLALASATVDDVALRRDGDRNVWTLESKRR